jgi:hypothetical protein
VTKRSFVFILSVSFFSTSLVFAQNVDRFDFKSSYGAKVTYAPNSSHILIGQAEGRSITTAGLEYTHRLWEKNRFKLDYTGEISPLYRQSDPTISGIEETYNGQTTKHMLASPERIIQSPRGIVGEDCVTYAPNCIPLYGIQGPNEITYGFATAPLGVRAVFLPKNRIQPTFTVNAGFVVTQRPIPIDGAAFLNYQFSFGPGVNIFASDRSSFGVEYLYRHISNGNADINPGIDQGIFCLTWRYYR